VPRGRERVVEPLALAGLAGALSVLAACQNAAVSGTSETASTTLRVGIGQVASSPGQGLRSIVQNLTVDSLATLTNEGRPRPSLAKDWVVSPDGLTLTINLVPGVKFHDGSPLTGAVVASALQASFRDTMGPALEDVDGVSAVTDQQVVVRFRTPSPFILDSLEVPIQKPGTTSIGTGAYAARDPKDLKQLRANDSYYLGRPAIDQISVETFPSVRSAWAELLRNRIDMLYDVGLDALDSLETSSNVSIFKQTRHYQYLILFNTQSPIFQSKTLRRALNAAVDRDAVVRDALNGHGTTSSGAFWPYNYAVRGDAPAFKFDPQAAAKLVTSAGRKQGMVRFHCLVPPDAVYERLALTVKRQLEPVGVDMVVEEASLDRIIGAVRTRGFEAALVEGVGGPTLLRPYQLWHSKGAGNPGGFGGPAIDAALDRIRHAPTERGYVQAVAEFQQTIVDDPPAIFLAWIERARAVSTRFRVPAPEPGRDILSTLYQWKPTEFSVRTQ